MKRLLEGLAPYIPDRESVDYTIETRARVDAAIQAFELSAPTRDAATAGLPVTSDAADQQPAVGSLKSWADLMGGKGSQVLEEFERSTGEQRTALAPVAASALLARGNAFYDEALTMTGSEADRYFKETAKNYAEALKIKPDFSAALYNWGNALLDQAQQKIDPPAEPPLDESKKKENLEEAERLLDDAGKKFDEALHIDPALHEAWRNWGNTLWEKAGLRTGQAAEGLFDQAAEKYAAALQLKSNDEVLVNWGDMLLDRAEGKSSQAAGPLLKEAGEKFVEALRIRPDLYEAWSGWANMFLMQAKLETSKQEAATLLQKAAERYERSDKLHPGYSTYPRACVAALQGKSSEARALLEESVINGALPSGSELDSDGDLDSIRGEPWFSIIRKAAK